MEGRWALLEIAATTKFVTTSEMPTGVNEIFKKRQVQRRVVPEVDVLLDATEVEIVRFR